MTVYFVTNNLVIDNISYETDEVVEEKRITRPLSIDGEKVAVKLIKKIDANVIYSSNYASAIGTAKYYSEYKNLQININSFLNDAKIGNIGNRNIKMLRYMQERDFNFKFDKGESLNEAANRMNLVVNRIIRNNMKNNVVIFTHKRAILAYLALHLDKGYNLDDRLILSFNDSVILDDVESDYNIIKVDYLKGKIENVEVID